MSKLTALITTLILGASTVAIADPGLAPAPIAGDQRHEGYSARRYRPAWIALTQPLQLDHGRDVIRLDSRGRRFSQLRIQTTAGASFIKRVVVQFADGSRQVVGIQRTLDVRHPIVQFQLEGNRRRIERIVLVGDSNRFASIQVFGI